MKYLNPKERIAAAPLFEGWEETMIWSCLQGIMGEAWSDGLREPESAQLLVGDFCFLAGRPHEGLVRHIPESFQKDNLLLLPRHEGWERLIETVHKERCRKIERYSLKKEADVFDRKMLEENVRKLPSDYRISEIGEELFEKVKEEDWSRDLCSVFSAYESYRRYGAGFVILHGEELVCGASSYSAYETGIEIEIDTKETYRRQGLARVCVSRLILECLERGIYPSWDAANPESLHLAVTLGYHFDKAYTAYELTVRS